MDIVPLETDEFAAERRVSLPTDADEGGFRRALAHDPATVLKKNRNVDQRRPVRRDGKIRRRFLGQPALCPHRGSHHGGATQPAVDAESEAIRPT
ncbi:hypothetical protein [Paraburkholderia caledonica]|uniref:Uncharacterized protein n=1 Tax=Paraburkholderia caledonica TaxID=134536 RepID=A0AB73INL2_9BURK|nr:hypothetical protein [Paraburkholderia caledonica]